MDYVDLKKKLEGIDTQYDCIISLAYMLTLKATKQYTEYREHATHKDYDETATYGFFVQYVITMASLENVISNASYISAPKNIINQFSWVKYPLSQLLQYSDGKINNLEFFGNIAGWHRGMMGMIWAHPWFASSVDTACNYINANRLAMSRVERMGCDDGHEHH